MRRGRSLLVVILVLGACSGGDDAAPSTSTSPTTVALTADVELSMAGSGFLVVRRDQEHFFVRGATFSVDDAGKLVAHRTLLQGWPARDGEIDVNGPILDLVVPTGFEVDERGLITNDERTIGQITIALFGAPDGLELVDGWLFRPTASSGLAALATVGVEGAGQVIVDRT